jgi:hypothetical protein
MKWLPLIFVGLAGAATNDCYIEDFYRIAWTVHNPTERHQLMMEWLDEKKCSREELATIYNNIAEWAGTADTPQLRYKIIRAYNSAPEVKK